MRINQKRFAYSICAALLMLPFVLFLENSYGPFGTLRMLAFIIATFLVQGVVESVVHECGHIFLGWLFGVTVTSITIGDGWGITLLRDSRCPVTICRFPYGGHVDFSALPLSRRARVAIYAGGMAATVVLTVIALCAIPHSLRWMRVEITMLSTLFVLTNLFGKASLGRWSDGEAIRGLLSYR
jgi:hypothetical protein